MCRDVARSGTESVQAELGHLLEQAVLDLPEQYRTVIMLRDVEELSTAETAAALELTEQNVKVRLHRGRAMARLAFRSRRRQRKNAFPFMGSAAIALSAWFLSGWLS